MCCTGTHIDSDITKLGPAHSMVHVVFAEVIFGQIRNVGLLNMWNVRRPYYSDIHDVWLSMGVFNSISSLRKLEIRRCTTEMLPSLQVRFGLPTISRRSCQFLKLGGVLDWLREAEPRLGVSVCRHVR